MRSVRLGRKRHLLPTSWGEVTVAQYLALQALAPFIANGYRPSEQLLLQISELTGAHPDTFAGLTPRQLQTASKTLDFMRRQAPAFRPISKFWHTNKVHRVRKEHSLEATLLREDAGRWVLLDQLQLLTEQAQTQLAAGNFAGLPLLVAALVFRPADWTDDRANAEALKALVREFHHLPLATAGGVAAFFMRG